MPEFWEFAALTNYLWIDSGIMDRLKNGPRDLENLVESFIALRADIFELVDTHDLFELFENEPEMEILVKTEEACTLTRHNL